MAIVTTVNCDGCGSIIASDQAHITIDLHNTSPGYVTQHLHPVDQCFQSWLGKFPAAIKQQLNKKNG